MLPKILNYDEDIQALPADTFCINSSCTPVGATVVTNNQQLIFDLPKSDFLVPDSLILRYQSTVSWTSGTTASQPIISGCPATAPFGRLDVYAGTQILETIQPYNFLYTTVQDITHDAAQKYGTASSLGYSAGNTVLMNCEETNGRVCGTALASGNSSETNTYSFPINCIISNMKKLYPLFKGGVGLRFIFTVDSNSNIFAYQSATSVTVCSISITNAELCYETINFGMEVEQTVRNNPTPLKFKTQTYALASNSIPSGTGGSQTYNFSMNYTSIKGVLLLPVATTTQYTQNALSGADTLDITQATGEYSINIGGRTYPDKPMSTYLYRNYLLQELRKVSTEFGNNIYHNIFDKTNSLSLSIAGWGYNQASAAALTNSGQTAQTATSATVPSKFMIPFHTARMHNQGENWLSGISSKGMNIAVKVNFGTATTPVTYNLYCAVCADVVVIFDEMNRVHVNV